MTEGLSPIGPDDTKMTGDFEGVHTPELQAELREAGEDNKEFKLTPEIEAMIMEKVQDISKKGLAVHCFKISNFESILTEGLTRNDKDHLFFNIIGRSIRPYMIGDTNSSYGDGLIFDISKVIEEAPIKRYTDGKNEGSDHFTAGKQGTYSCVDNSVVNLWNELYDNLKPGDEKIIQDVQEGKHKEKYLKEHVDEDGLPRSNREFGYAYFGKISPALFQGLIMQKKEQLDRFVSVMEGVLKKNYNLYIPIYDSSGDLLWPRQMSYEEVIQFVAERDKDKTEQEQ